MLYSFSGAVRIIGFVFLLLSVFAFFGAIAGSGWTYLILGGGCLVLSALSSGRSGPL